MQEIKESFQEQFKEFTQVLSEYVSDEKGYWKIRGFVDVDGNIYPISNDTKMVSKTLEIHIQSLIRDFATKIGYSIVLTDCQNYYPNLSFVKLDNEDIKFAVDLKSTYRHSKKMGHCNGFTLGSHAGYFVDRKSHKNVQFPYGDYLAHFCLGVLYTRVEGVFNENRVNLSELQSMSTAIKDINFFFVEKWKIASDIRGSGNTANIGSVKRISDIMHENGTFRKYGEEIFDDYWINYGKLTVITDEGKVKKMTKFNEYLKYKSIERL